ncbi:MAG: universal stress protein [Eggerthellaceae bacterium]|nr:universal stress protein [Eggerthellaceae bacterium]
MSQSYSKIFAALDADATQDAVLEKAIDLATREGASLYLGHVIDSLPYEAAGADFGALTLQKKEELEEKLRDVLDEIKHVGKIPHVEIIVKAGRVAETLLDDIIKTCDPDLVVCGERGLSNIQYVFVGSISTYLIRHVRCDVLVVKQK